MPKLIIRYQKVNVSLGEIFASTKKLIQDARYTKYCCLNIKLIVAALVNISEK